MDTQQLILVVGASGKTGRRVSERLRARGLAVRAVSRSTELAFDWTNPATWPAVLDGVQSAYITFQPDLAVPGSVEVISAFSRLAVERGVRRLVLLSGRGEEQAQRCEQVLQDSGAEWTIVRADWFNQNFSEDFLIEGILRGEVVLPVGDVLEPFVDADDIADVVVAALTEDRHNGQVYEVSGPRLMTFAQAVDEIAAASGRDLRFVQAPLETYLDGMRAAGFPEGYIWLVNFLFTTVLDGRNSSLTDGVQRALGRSPRDFSEFARRAAATGVWNAPEPEHAAADSR